MSFTIWVGLFGTLVGVGFLLNSIKNLRASPEGHAANAGRLHIAMVSMFLPIMWLIIIMGLFSA
ncbi:MAG: hypothetical protein AAFS13_02755 [Pseudomonadota bacterium]